MLAIFGGYWQDEEGVTTVEYALIIAVIVLGTIAAWNSLDTRMNHAIDTVARDDFGS